MAVHCLPEALEGRLRLNSLSKAVPQMTEKRTNKVEVSGKPGFWELNQVRVTGNAHESQMC